MASKRRYLPTNDLLFKRVISNASHPEVTCGFISDMLGIEVGEVSLMNPYDVSWFRDALNDRQLGYTVVDALVGLNDGSQAVVEMQVSKHGYFLERMLYNTSRRFLDVYGSEHLMLATGGYGKYSALRPAYGIGILDFTLFADDADPLRSYSLYDLEHHGFYGSGAATARLGGLLSLTFLELGKPIENVPRGIAHWMSFFSGGTPTGDAPGYILTALELADEQRLSKEEVDMLELIDLGEEDRKAQLAFAKEEGRDERSREVAKAALLKGSDIGFVADITGLDRADVERIASELEA
jgi:predicted transposase/invertase (TIGR01784 family)